MGGREGDESNEDDEEGDEGEQDREEQDRQDRLEGGFGGAEEEVRRQQGAGLGESMLEGQEGTQYQGLRSFRRQDCGWQGLACQSPGHLQGRLSFFACESG